MSMSDSNGRIDFRGPNADSRLDFLGTIAEVIREHGARRICDIGGGANPTLPIEQVRALGLDYTLLDISQKELDHAHDGYRKVCADITSPDLALDGGYDLAVSAQLAEHVRDGEAFHRNVFRLLGPGGRAVHYFPTLFAPPLLANRLLPEPLLDAVNRSLWKAGSHPGRYAKFPAWYSWCLGPSVFQFGRFASLGYEVEHYTGYFGHSYYDRVPPLARAHRRWSNRLAARGVWPLTAGALVRLRRPA